MWDGEAPGIALERANAADAPLPSYELAYDAASPLLGVDDPYLLVNYTV